MKCNYCLRVVLAVFLAALPLAGRATVFFNDTFNNGSTLNSASPADPTDNSTAYQVVSSKTWTQTNIAPNQLRFGIAATGAGSAEVEALFTTNAVALVQPGDYIQLTVVFTNVSGYLVTNGAMGIGLYNAGQVKPLAGGCNGTATTASTFTGGAQHWVGYVAQTSFTNTTSRIMTRPNQTATSANGNNQDLITSGSGSTSYAGSTTVGPTFTMLSKLTQGAVYTDVLIISLYDAQTVAVTNFIYAGPDAGGTLITNFGATNSLALAGAFDGLAFGYRAAAAGNSNVVDISSIKVEGSVTSINTPPTIDINPVPVNVATNGSCLFTIAATGFNMTYQWYRNGTNLLNGGNISGATSSTLVISHAGTADAASGANGYYCVVTGAGNLSATSTTNSLTLVPAKNLIWNGNGTDWDLNTSANWNDPVNPATFNYGDSVTFDDTGAANANVTLTGNFLSASQWLVTGGTAYAFGGTGSFAGTGSLVFNSSAGGNIQLNVVNTHTGGTIVSNDNPALNVYVQKYQVLGNGPLTLAKAGTMELATAGSASVGIPGDVAVNDDFTVQFDGTGTFAGVFLGNISGTAGKTLTLTPQNNSPLSRYRFYGTNTVCNANIVLNGNASSQALYDGTVLAPYGATGTQTYNGAISGVGGIVQRGNNTTILAGASTYSGGTFTTAGTIAFGSDTSGNVTSGPIGTGPLFVAPEINGANGSGTVLAYGGARTIANPVQYPSATNSQTLIIGGTNQLTFSGPVDLQGQDATGTQNNRTFQVANTAPTIFAGVVGDNGSGFGLTKTGAGALYLNNAANTYTGATTNSAGLLAGSGSLAGSVVVKTNASIGGGSAATIGTLTVGGDLTFENGGGGFFRVNRSGFVSDKVSVAGTLAGSGAGRITVTNLGSTLQLGDTFTLFNKAVTGGNTLVVTGAVSAGLTWTNKLAVDGTIQVVQGFATYATNISYSVSGSTLTVTWPATHQGWFLQAQTNSLSTGLGTNWVTIPGTDATTTTNLPIVPGNPSVFYRLKMP